MPFRKLVILPMVLLTAACFQGQRTFRVNADGSGTIVDSVRLGEQARGMTAAFEQMDKSSPAEKKAKKEAKYKEKAAALGEGVTLVSVEKTPDGGERVTYAFKDISKVKATLAPTMDENETSKDQPVTFRISTQGGNTLLTVASPQPAPSTTKNPKPKPSPEDAAKEIAMMKGMLSGLKMSAVVEVNGKLVKTNSPYASGSSVTLLEIDFDQLDEAGLKKLAEAGPAGPPPLDLMRGVKGLKIPSPEVTIEFAGK
jgi:hypothetical protein